MTHVRFIIPARNEAKHLAGCLEAIRDQRPSGCDWAVVVVDNASTDQTAEIARRYGAEVIDVPPGNPGRSRNAGAATAPEADFFAFVDADCLLPPGWLARCLQHMADPSVVGCGAIQAGAPPEAPWVERTWVAAIAPPPSDRWQCVDWLPAFNLMVRAAAFRSLGGFDGTLLTCEDSDLSFRLRTHGQLRRDHQVAVRHLGESQTLSEFFRREMWRSGGNFRSVWRRGSLSGELPSLVIPFAYTAFCAAALVTLPVALWRSSLWAWAVTLGAAALLIVAPLLIAAVRYRGRRWLPTGSLLAVYLLARGIGPFVTTRRVERR